MDTGSIVLSSYIHSNGMTISGTVVPDQLRFSLDRGAVLPTRSHGGDAGYDLSAVRDTTIPAHTLVVVGTGVHVEAPEGFWLLQAARSSLCLRHHLMMAHGIGVIDNGYRGEIKCPLYNFGDEDVTIEADERVSQLVLMPLTTPEPIAVAKLSDSDRGSAGYGSTGAM